MGALTNRTDRARWAVPALLALFALAVRLWQIGSESIWLDEATSLFLARMDVPDVIAWTAADIHPPLYYLMLHFWRLFGESEAAIRSLSAVAGALSVVVLYGLGAHLFDRRTGFVAGLLLALAPMSIWYSQQVRMYTWLGFWALLSSYFLVLALDRWKAGYWAAYALACAASLYTHYYTVFVFLAQGLFVLYAAWRSRRWRDVLRTAGGMLGSVVLFAPWLPTMITQVTSGGGGWVARGGTPGPRALLEILVGFSVGNARTLYPSWARWLVYGLLAGLSAWAVIRAIRASARGDRAESRGVAFALLYVAAPVLAAWLVSQVKPLYSDRYLLAFLPGYLLLAARGGASLPRAAMRWGVAALLAAALGFGVFRMAQTPQTDDWQSAAASVSGRVQPGDVAVFYPGWNEKPFGYYLTDALPSWTWFKVPLPPDEVESSVLPGIQGYRRAWLIWSVGHYGDPHGMVKAYMDENHKLVDVQQFRGPIGVALYDLSP